jgi:fatty-acyl-CoA synthase
VNRYARTLGLVGSDRIVSWLPLYHDMGLISSFILPLMADVGLVFMDAFEWVEAPSLLFRAMETYHGTHTWLPNFAFHHLCNTAAPGDRFDLSRMKAFIDCSEPCKPETFDLFCARFADLGVTREKLQVCYAMAEAVFAVTQTAVGTPVGVLRVDDQELTANRRARDGMPGVPTRAFLSVGEPIAGMEIKIVNGEGEALADGDIGEVAIRGVSLFSGYYQLPEETQKRLRDGWYYSRDLGFRRQGYLYITGRNDDLIIVHGKNYYAHDIEFCVQGTDRILPGRAVAVGIYNPVVGTEEIVILAETNMTAAEEKRAGQALLKQYVFDQLGLLIRKVEWVPPGWLIKTTSGKLSRSENKKKYQAQSGLQARPLDANSKG